MNATSYYWSYTDFYKFITYTSFITYTYNYGTTAGAKSRSRWKCSQNFCKFYRETPLLKSLFYKVASIQACNIIKKRFLQRCFPVNFEKFFRAPILKNIYERLLLYTEYFIIYWFMQFTTVHVFQFCNSFFFNTQLK